MGKKKRQATGVYITGESLRIVALSRTASEISLSALVCIDLPQAQTSTYLDEEWRAALHEALQRAQRQAGHPLSTPLLALDNSLVNLKRRPLVPDQPKEQRRHLLWEAGHFLRGPLSEYGIDCALGRDWGFVVAVRRSILTHYIQVFKGAGLVDLDFDISPFALANILEGTGQQSQARSQLLLDLSPSGASAALLKGDALHDAFACPWERGLDLEARLNDLAPRLQSLLADEDGPERVWLTGPGGTERDWQQALQDYLPNPSQSLDPFQGLQKASLSAADPALLEAAPAFAVPAGLAYRGIAA